MRSPRTALVAGLLAPLLHAGPVASQGAPAPTRDWRGTGTVIAVLPAPSSLHPTRPVIIIHHEPIPGLMEETMDMPFIAAFPDLVEGLRAGDRIAFVLKDTPGALLVVSIERLRAR
jgi:Cu/Ag efflux protein CusF